MNLSDYLNRSNLTISNGLSLLRIILIPIIILLFYYGDAFAIDYIAIPLIFIAMATDFFDGYLARKLNQETELGKILDPLADKFAIASIALYFYFQNQFPLWLILAIILRDLIIVLGAIFIIEKKHYVIPSNIFGKMTTGIIFLLFIVIIFQIDFLKLPFEIMSGGMIFISFLSYIKGFFSNVGHKKES